MEQKQILTFNVNNLFNNERLKQYDADVQKGFLGYLMRYKNWEIEDNKIIFPEIETTAEIEKVLLDYNNTVLKNILYIKRQALSDITRLGTYNYEQILDKKIEEIEKNEDNKKMKRKNDKVL